MLPPNNSYHNEIRKILRSADMERTLWTEKKFGHDLPEGWLPNILERLKGTIIRLQYTTATLTEEQLILQPAGKWSIKEHIGHLSDLEELHEGRIEDFITRKPTLRAADMSNAKTQSAQHNKVAVKKLIDDFRKKREAFISRMEKLDAETQSFRSLHPRLKQQMKPVDMAFFTAEHDDHHLATIRNIIKSF